jgi:hypothetical protein
MLFRLALVGMTGACASVRQRRFARGERDPSRQPSNCLRGPAAREKQRALQRARQLYGSDVRLIAATDITGYGAIAVARKGNKAVNGLRLASPHWVKQNGWQSNNA